MSDKHLSSQFDSELTSVSTRVMEMGGMVESQIRTAVYALAQFSAEASAQVTDDYITKPFSTQELLARIRAVLCRRAPETINDTVTVGGLELDAMTYRVSFQGEEYKLGPTEFKILHY
jgi:phosphate uptake regulator